MCFQQVKSKTFTIFANRDFKKIFKTYVVLFFKAKITENVNLGKKVKTRQSINHHHAGFCCTPFIATKLIGSSLISASQIFTFFAEMKIHTPFSISLEVFSTIYNR